MISPSQNSYSIVPPSDQDVTTGNGVFSGYYLYVTYDNASLLKTGTQIIINNQNNSFTTAYSFNGNLDLLNNVGLAINSHSICQIAYDGSFVFIEGTPIGIIGGDENPNFEPGCSGVRGSFYYQNNQLFGLGNDTANTTMYGVDALANIESYITSPFQTDIVFEYQTPLGSVNTNSILELFFAYSTPCDTFSVTVTPDTIICQGSQLQLNITGGQTYEWFPATGLSCSDCPNPIFTADITMNYTVQIWNADSCSVIHPVSIKVVPNPSFQDNILTASDCGTSNGEAVLTPDNFSIPPHQYSVNGGAFQASNTFTGLTSGNNLFTMIDSIGCSADSTIIIPEQNLTQASVEVDPLTGFIPLDITVTNNSANATNYEWYLNGNYKGTAFTNFTCNTSGTYTVQLIAWQYDPSCADTSYASVIAFQEVIVPTAFTPNNDLVNDYWNILNLDEQYPNNTVQVFNRWGNLIYQSEEGNYAQKPWDGIYQGELLSVASYYFIIQLNDEVSEDIKGTVSIIKN